MQKIDLGQTITILANAGVIAGIIFLAFEIRQNTQAVQASSFQNYTDGALEWNYQLTANADLAEIFSRYLARDEGLNEFETLRVTLMMRSQWYRFQNAYSQQDRDALSSEDWEVARQLMCISPEGVDGITRQAALLRRDTWSEHKPYLNPSFVAFIESADCWG